MSDLAFSGVNTKMGSLITLKIKGTEGNLADTEQIEEIITTLVSETVLELRSDGSIVYD